MKKSYFPSLMLMLSLVVVAVSFTMSLTSCEKSKKTIVDEAQAASIIIEDVKVMGPKPGTGVNNCTCDSSEWSSYWNLTTTDANIALASFNLPTTKSRAIVLCEVTFPDNSTRQFKLTFDKGCNVLKLKSCTGAATIIDQKKTVKVDRSGFSMKIKPDYDKVNTGKFVVTPTNCNGCKFRYKRCPGDWTWEKCAPF